MIMSERDARGPKSMSALPVPAEEEAAEPQWLFLLPALIVSLSVVLVPVIVTDVARLHRLERLQPAEMGRAGELPRPSCRSRGFWAAFRNNCVYVPVRDPADDLLAVRGAVMLMMIRRGRTFF